MDTPSIHPAAILGLGLLLGLRHAMDPDHVVAVTAIAARTRRAGPAAWLGIVWGAGHTLTLWAVGAVLIVFNLVVPPRVGLALEFAVALALVLVGLLNLRSHATLHSELEDAPSGPLAKRAFLVGLVHGLAGSAAVALLVLATVRDTALACGYLGVFAFGTLLGMTLVTTGLAIPMSALAQRFTLAPGTLRVATGLLSLCFGLWLAWQIGWVDGLFTAAPRWSPH
jgi:high-affinity nickel-transport protein